MIFPLRDEAGGLRMNLKAAAEQSICDERPPEPRCMPNARDTTVGCEAPRSTGVPISSNYVMAVLQPPNT